MLVMGTLWINPELLVLFGCLVLVTGKHVQLTATTTAKEDLISPNYPSNYGNNVMYDYLVTTNYPNHTITFTLVDCDIEHDKNSACLYDHLYIYDGVNSSATLIVDFCCGTTSASWETTGNQAYLLFTSDITTSKRGFQLEYQSTGWTSTTTTSTTTTTPTTISTTTTTAATSSTNAKTTGSGGGDGGGGGASTPPWGIIIGCTLGGCLLILLLILAIRYFCKKKQQPRGVTSDTTDTEIPSENKREYLSFENNALSRI